MPRGFPIRPRPLLAIGELPMDQVTRLFPCADHSMKFTRCSTSTSHYNTSKTCCTQGGSDVSRDYFIRVNYVLRSFTGTYIVQLINKQS